MVIGHHQQLLIIFTDNNTAARRFLLLFHILSPEIRAGNNHLICYGNDGRHGSFHHLCHIRYHRAGGSLRYCGFNSRIIGCARLLCILRILRSVRSSLGDFLGLLIISKRIHRKEADSCAYTEKYAAYHHSYHFFHQRVHRLPGLFLLMLLSLTPASGCSAIIVIGKSTAVLVISLLGLIAAITAVAAVRLSVLPHASLSGAVLSCSVLSRILISASLIRAALISALRSRTAPVTCVVLVTALSAVLVAARIHPGIAARIAASRITSCIAASCIASGIAGTVRTASSAAGRLSVIMFCMSSITAALDSLRIILFIHVFV